MHDLTINGRQKQRHQNEPNVPQEPPFWDAQRIVWTIVCAVPGLLVLAMIVAQAIGWLHVYH